MSRIPLEESERYNNRRVVTYQYYDTPDGEDLFPKLLYVNKYAVLFGGLLGLIDSFARVPFALTHKERFFRIIKCTVPPVGVASAFTVATFYATKWRGDKDEWNYVIGGIAAGTIIGATVSRVSAGFYSSIFFGCIGFCKKYCELRNTKILERKRLIKHWQPYYRKNVDFTLLSDNKGNWTREPAK